MVEDIQPFLIEYKCRTLKEAEKMIYAFNSITSFNASLAELEGIVIKLGGKGFQFTRHPNSAQYIRFFIQDKNVGDVPIHVDIPQIFLTTDRKPRRLLKNEGIRLAVLDLKVKLYKIGGNRSTLSIMAENILTRSGKPLSRFLTEGSTILGLLPQSVE